MADDATTLTDVPLRLFTVDEVETMAAAAVFGEGEQIDLWDGRIYAMAPEGEGHQRWNARAVRALMRVLLRIDPDERSFMLRSPAWIRIAKRRGLTPDLCITLPSDGVTRLTSERVLLAVETTDQNRGTTSASSPSATPPPASRASG
jgi:Uma2 family endonuclease